MENCTRIKYRNGSFLVAVDNMCENRKDIFEDLYNVDIEKQFTVIMRGFDDARRDNYFGGFAGQRFGNATFK